MLFIAWVTYFQIKVVTENYGGVSFCLLDGIADLDGLLAVCLSEGFSLLCVHVVCAFCLHLRLLVCKGDGMERELFI